jgi:hypothetical protein
LLSSTIHMTDPPGILRRLDGVEIPRPLRRLTACVVSSPLRRLVRKALALTPRGFVRHDVLVLCDFSAQLRVEWRTRDIHPWDGTLPADRRCELFRDQAFHDTDAAIARLFRILPDLDTIEVRVVEPRPPNRAILAGTVARGDADAARSLASPGMRLRLMGVRCRLEGGRLAPLD